MDNRFEANANLSIDYSESWQRLQQVNKTSEQLQQYWVGFITICAFIIATAMSVTHSDIFLLSPLKLPVISVELPLFWFFLVSPILIFFLHVFLLVKYRFLLETLDWFKELQAKPGEKGNKHHPVQMEEHLNNTIMMRSLDVTIRDANSKEIRDNRFSKFFTPILNGTLTLLPVILMLVLQGKILPYQHTTLEITYRTLVVFEAIVVFWAFREYLMRATERFWLLLFAIGISIFISLHLMSSSAERIAAGDWDKSILPWSPILSPDNRDFVNDDLLSRDDGRGTRFLQNRHFVGAELEYADLRGINLNNSDFRYANLLRAKLDGATIKNADFSFTNLENASVIRTDFDDVRMWGANLSKANFSGADLKRGEFHGSNLEQAVFDGGNMKKARFVGTNLRHASLIGANLKDSVFVASYIGQANFSGAELKRALFASVILNGQQLLKAQGLETCRQTSRQGNQKKSIVPECDSININHDFKIVSPGPNDIRENKILLPFKEGDKSLNPLFKKYFERDQVLVSPRYETFDQVVNKYTRNDYKKIWDLNIVAQHCSTQTLRDSHLKTIRLLLFDGIPNFDAANLSGAKFDGKLIENKSLKVSLFGERRNAQATKSKSHFTRSHLNAPPSYWGNEKLNHSDAHKLHLVGCREAIATRLYPTNSESILFVHKFDGDVNDQGKLNKIICTAGAYPHVANTLILSGRLRIQGNESKTHYRELAQSIIMNRCSAMCPGANNLHRNAITELWNIAHYNSATFLPDLPYTTVGVPQVVAQCDLWRKFKLDEMNTKTGYNQ